MLRSGLFGSIRRPVKPNANQKTTTSRTAFLLFSWKKAFSSVPPCNSTKKIFLCDLREISVKTHKEKGKKAPQKANFEAVFRLFEAVFCAFSQQKKDAFQMHLFYRSKSSRNMSSSAFFASCSTCANCWRLNSLFVLCVLWVISFGSPLFNPKSAQRMPSSLCCFLRSAGPPTISRTEKRFFSLSNEVATICQ